MLEKLSICACFALFWCGCVVSVLLVCFKFVLGCSTSARFALRDKKMSECLFHCCDEHLSFFSAAKQLLSALVGWSTFQLSARPDRYDRKAVTEQLRYGGVLQAETRNSSNKKLLGTSASLLVTSAFLLVTRSH